jgi:hypothetical protein
MQGVMSDAPKKPVVEEAKQAAPIAKPGNPKATRHELQLAAIGNLDRGRRVRSLVTEEVGSFDVDNRVCRLPSDCDSLESIWLEFPEGYKPVHAFGIYSAFEDVGLYVNEQQVTTVSCFDLFAFGTQGPHPNLIKLPLVPASGLQIRTNPKFNGLVELRMTLKDPVKIKVVVAKKYYDAGTKANPPVTSSLMYEFYSLRAAVNEPGAVVPVKPMHPTLQIAVALVDPVRGDLLSHATRVSLIMDEVAFELSKMDPLNPNPKGIYTYTFEPYGNVCALPTMAEVRTTFNMSHIQKAYVRITTEGLPDGCVAFISTLSENILEDFKFR